MGLKSTFSDWMFGMFSKSTATTLPNQPDRPKKPTLFSNLRCENYLIAYLSEVERAHMIRSATHELLEGIDVSTVFICGGFASYIAGFTTEYGDIDFFCTSRSSFDELAMRLSRKEKINENILKGEFDRQPVNVIYNPNAASIEDLLNGFDMNWCRVGIDLGELCLVMHPEANYEDPIFDSSCFLPENIGMTSDAAIKRTVDRFVKYVERRVKKLKSDKDYIRSMIAVYIENLSKIKTANTPATNSPQIYRTAY